MPQKFEPPSAFKKSFTCPHCGAITQQSFSGNIEEFRGTAPLGNGSKVSVFMGFVAIRCLVCQKLSIFRCTFSIPIEYDRHPFQFKLYSDRKTSIEENKLIYPNLSNIAEANADMPDEVKEFYNEARIVAKNSTRAATALLRIATEKLVKDLLGLEGKDYANTSMHNAIERLKTEKGLSSTIYNALMALKLFGNEAAHPNEDIGRLESYFSNDSDLMNKLFALLNIIVGELISKPKEIESLFETAPRK